MNDIISDAARVMSLFCKPLGDYAPKVRQLIADYKDQDGIDHHQDLVTMHPPGATDAFLVKSVQQSLAEGGYTLTAIGEFMEDGCAKALYLAPGYLEEAIREMGLKVPEDMTAAMRAAGVHPVNWEELTRNRRK